MASIIGSPPSRDGFYVGNQRRFLPGQHPSVPEFATVWVRMVIISIVLCPGIGGGIDDLAAIGGDIGRNFSKNLYQMGHTCPFWPERTGQAGAGRGPTGRVPGGPKSPGEKNLRAGCISRHRHLPVVETRAIPPLRDGENPPGIGIALPEFPGDGSIAYGAR